MSSPKPYEPLWPKRLLGIFMIVATLFAGGRLMRNIGEVAGRDSGKICYSCSRPAVVHHVYGGGAVVGYCEKHRDTVPPGHVVRAAGGAGLGAFFIALLSLLPAWMLIFKPREITRNMGCLVLFWLGLLGFALLPSRW